MDQNESHTRINENGRVVIPASFRRALGIRSGDTVVLRIENQELRLTTLRQRLAKAQQLVRKHLSPATSLADELIAERREAARRE
jgi:AbrB family looped-hinge helix DNA binding protein